MCCMCGELLLTFPTTFVSFRRIISQEVGHPASGSLAADEHCMTQGIWELAMALADEPWFK